MLSFNGKSVAFWLIIGLVLVAVFNLYQGTQAPVTNGMDYSEFVSQVDGGHIADVMIRGDHVAGHTREGKSFTTYVPAQDATFVSNLLSHQVRVKVAPPEEATPSFFQILLSWFPMLLLIGVWIFFLRQMQGGAGRAMGFGKSKCDGKVKATPWDWRFGPNYPKC